jgi:hypothetical protein
MDDCQFNQANQNGHMNQQIDLTVVSMGTAEMTWLRGSGLMLHPSLDVWSCSQLTMIGYKQ